MDENQLANVFRNLQNTERFRVRLLFVKGKLFTIVDCLMFRKEMRYEKNSN